MIQCCKQIKAHVQFQFNYEISYMDLPKVLSMKVTTKITL